jgi:hypothetical protein
LKRRTPFPNAKCTPRILLYTDAYNEAIPRVYQIAVRNKKGSERIPRGIPQASSRELGSLEAFKPLQIYEKSSSHEFQNDSSVRETQLYGGPPLCIKMSAAFLPNPPA